MLALDSDPFVASLSVATDLDGAQAILLAVKACYSLDALPRLLDAQEDILPADDYYGDPNASSLRYPADLQLPQPGTSIGLVGQAWIPDGHQRGAIDIGVQVGDLRKTARVFGDRVWEGGSISDPQPFSSMPLTFENAFGGTHHFRPDLPLGPDSAIAFDANPVGKGFIGKRRGDELNEFALPNLEDPSNLITSLRDRPAPVAPGFIAPHWLARRRFAGTYNDSWQQQRAPLWPRDLNPRFFQAGAPGFNLEQAFLQGGTPIRLLNLHPALPRIDTVVPADRPLARAWMDGSQVDVSLRLETLRLEPDAGRMVLVWRGLLRCERKVLKVSRIRIRPAAPVTEAVA